jgi:PAS domain S-box-containing protein
MPPAPSATAPDTAAGNRRPPPLIGASIITAAAYVAIGWLSLYLAIPPSFAAPLYLPAGIALACVLRFGYGVLPAIAVGSFGMNLLTGILSNRLGLDFVVISLVSSLGAALQAWAGVALYRRLLGADSTLDEPRDILRFFLVIAPASALLSASAAIGIRVLWGALPADAAFGVWWTWWAGDVLGMLIAAPVALCLIGRDRSVWAPRTLTVAAPLLLMCALLALAIIQISLWERERLQARFEQDANAAAQLLRARLDQSVSALLAIRELTRAKPLLGIDEFRRGTYPWVGTEAAVQRDALWSMAYSNYVAETDRGLLEQRMRAMGAASFRVFDRPEPQDGEWRADGPALAITHIEPMATNSRALGVNQMSIPELRTTIEKARSTDQLTASAPFRLTHPTTPQLAVALYAPLFAGEPRSVDDRQAQFRGTVHVTLRPDVLMQQIRQNAPSYMRICLIDQINADEPIVLSGEPVCRQPPQGHFMHRSSMEFGTRQWTLVTHAPLQSVPGIERQSTYVFSIAGIASTALFGALLLSMSGRARRVEAEVAERTALLRTEVAHRQSTEEALRESEQRLRVILDTAPIGIVYADADGRLLLINDAYAALSGGNQRDSLIAEGVSNADAPIAVTAIDALRDEPGGTRTFTARSCVESGRTLRVSLRRLDRAASGDYRLVGVVEDVTEQLAAAEARQRQFEAEAANRAKTAFLSRMSHELRTPLNAMLGFVQLLRQDQTAPLTVLQQARAERIEEAGWHLLALIDDVLDVARIESGQIDIGTEAVQTREVIDEAVTICQVQAQARGIALSMSLRPHAWVQANRMRLRQVLINLITNGIKYNHRDGHVRVDVQLAGRAAKIAVEDDGIGMSAEQHAQLFQPFNRLGRDKFEVEGLGLGLALCRQLMRAMGGDIEVDAAHSRGTRMVITLPLADAPEPQAASDEAPISGDAATEVAPLNACVLYIEDNRINALLVEDMLRRLPGVRFEHASLGVEGLRLIDELQPDLVLLDMHLPDCSGLEILELLQSGARTTAGLTPKPKVVALSANALPDDVARARALGAMDYWTKPLDMQHFLAGVARLLHT